MTVDFHFPAVQIEGDRVRVGSELVGPVVCAKLRDHGNMLVMLVEDGSGSRGCVVQAPPECRISEKPMTEDELLAERKFRAEIEAVAVRFPDDRAAT